MTTNTDDQIQEWENVHREVAWGDVPERNFVKFASGNWSGLAAAFHFLEIGAGAGAQVKWLADRGYNVTAVDASPMAIKRLKSRIVTLHNVNTQVRDIRTYMNGQSIYDCVLDVCCLQHLTEDEAELVTQRARRWLKPGGCFWSKQVIKDHGLNRTSYMRCTSLDTIQRLFMGYNPVKIELLSEVARGDVPIHHAVVVARNPL